MDILLGVFMLSVSFALFCAMMALYYNHKVVGHLIDEVFNTGKNVRDLYRLIEKRGPPEWSPKPPPGQKG